MSARTWADGHGVWHVRVPVSGAVPALLQARAALRDELNAREAGPVAREVWMHPVRVPELDAANGDTLRLTAVYRERLDTDESVQVERARAELETARRAEQAALVAYDTAGEVRRAARRRVNELLAENA